MVYTQLNVKIVLFQTIQFRISTHFKCQTVLFDQFNCQKHFYLSYSVYSNSSNSNNSVLHKYTVSSIKPIDRALSGATTPGQSGPVSDGMKRFAAFLQSSSIIGTLQSDCLVSYVGHSLVGGGSYPTAVQDDWAKVYWSLTFKMCLSKYSYYYSAVS